MLGVVLAVFVLVPLGVVFCEQVVGRVETFMGEVNYTEVPVEVNMAVSFTANIIAIIINLKNQ